MDLAFRLDQKRMRRSETHAAGSGDRPRVVPPDCDDVCEAELRISSTKGPISLEGRWAPGANTFSAERLRSADAPQRVGVIDLAAPLA
jgi:hypothetical protein